MNNMERLTIKFDGIEVYQAGLPHFPRNFTRDSIISAILMNDAKMLKNQLSFCASRQGKKTNPYSGEEPGKIFHEYPGFKINGHSTEYNSCDTTALFLIGHEVYQKLTGDTELANKSQRNLESSLEYILSHLKDGFFVEDPKFSGSDDFALKVTYWKDSEIFGRESGKPKYPVVYTLAHIQNMRGLRSAEKLLGSGELSLHIEKMVEALPKLYDDELGYFYIAIDSQGPIKAISSDALHALFYLSPNDLPRQHVERIVKTSQELETPLGYRTLSLSALNHMKDTYHTNTVWPFEQAIIHEGAGKFGLGNVQEVSSRVKLYLDTDPELFVLEGEGSIKKGGCDPQLWTIAAKEYFKAPKSEHFV